MELVLLLLLLGASGHWGIMTFTGDFGGATSGHWGVIGAATPAGDPGVDSSEHQGVTVVATHAGDHGIAQTGHCGVTTPAGDHGIGSSGHRGVTVVMTPARDHDIDSSGHRELGDHLQDASTISTDQGPRGYTEEVPRSPSVEAEGGRSWATPDLSRPLADDDAENPTPEEPGKPTLEGKPGNPTLEGEPGKPTLEEEPGNPTPGEPILRIPTAEPKSATLSSVPSNEPPRPTHDLKGRAGPLDRIEGQAKAANALPYCICDLSPGACDINCCCDSDCGLSDPLSIFSSCLPGSTRAVSQVCVESTLLFRNNSPLTTTTNATATPNQFCVQLNDSNLNFFVDPQNVTQTDFPGLVAEHGGLFFSGVSLPAPSFPLFYKVGDPILTLSDSSTLGVLRQPAALGPGGACVDKNPAGFLESQSTSCVRTLTNLSCTSDPALNAASYYQSFAVLKVPQAVNSSSVSPQVTIALASTPESPLLLDSTCINVVSQVSYVIEYNGTQGIQKVSVSFTLTNLSRDPGSSLLQSFSFLFRSSQQSTQDTVRRSGNPGFLIGAPLLTSVDGTRQPVTLIQSQSDGACSGARTNALFGTNMRTGCRFSEVAVDSCKGFAEQLHQALQGTRPPQNLAMFGNVDPGQADKWTQVIYKNCTNQNEGSCSTGCTIPVSLEIQVLWAEVGLRSNPQAQVLGARYQNHCKLLKCQSPVILETVLSFIDTTLHPELPRGQPATDWKLPFDFFFPFEVALSGGSELGRDLLDTILFPLAALTFHSVFRQ